MLEIWSLKVYCVVTYDGLFFVKPRKVT